MRGTGSIRLALGVLLLARPDLPARLTRTPTDGRVRGITRVLGGRYAAQGALDLVLPHDRRLDVAVELLHAASMLPLARRGHPHARLALLSAGVAAALAGADGLSSISGA